MREKMRDKMRGERVTEGEGEGLEVALYLEFHITKLIALSYKNNLLITYKMWSFPTPNFFNGLLFFIFRQFISLLFLGPEGTWRWESQHPQCWQAVVFVWATTQPRLGMSWYRWDW